jgi:hypothetical protein
MNENSLTPPTDRTSVFVPSNTPPLNANESVEAFKELSIAQKPLFTRADRRYVDPLIKGQEIALISFVPSENAVADKHGVFGFAKIRGVFENEEKAQHRAMELIQQVDSHNKIYHVKVGSPFPIVRPSDSEKFSSDVDEVDLRAEAKNCISKFVRQAGEEDQKKMEELQERERQLREDVSKTPEQHEAEKTPLDKYIFARKKLSDNLYVFTEHRNKLHEVKAVIIKAEKEAEDIAEQFPNVLDEYKEKFDKVSKETGLDRSKDSMALMIKQYFNDKPNLQEIFGNNQV